MDRNNRPPAVRMDDKVMTSLGRKPRIPPYAKRQSLPALSAAQVVPSHLDCDLLNADEFIAFEILFRFKAKLVRLADTFHQYIQGTSLRMTSLQLRHAGDVIALRIALDHDVKFFGHG